MRFAFWRRRTTDDFAAEIESHVALETERLIRSGMTREQALSSARRTFGSATTARERFREERRAQWLDAFVHDVSFSFRLMRRNPGFTAVAALTLAIGIGASTAVFSIVKGALIDPWPYAAADRIVTTRGEFPKLGQPNSGLWSVAEFGDLRARTDVFDYVIAGQRRTASLTQGDFPERVIGAQMTADAFPMLGVKALLGRVFSPDEDRPGAAKVVVLSYTLWMNRFAGDIGIVGKAIRFDDQPYTVIGVMPREFVWWDSEFWLPLAPDLTEIDRSHRTIAVQGRLRQGITVRAAEAALEVSTRETARRFGAEVPEYEGFHVHLIPLRDDVLRNVRESLLILLGAVGFLLLVASANVANLLLTKATARRREIAVRIALGAGRKRIIRQLMTESVLLAAAGGVAGCALAVASIGAIVSLIPYGFLPVESHVRLSPGVLLFATVLSLVTGMLFGLAPALQTSNANLHDALKQGSGKVTGDASGRRLRNGLVVCQVALAFVMLSGATALLRSYRNLERKDLGFLPGRVTTMRIALPESGYQTAAQTVNFFERLRQDACAIPRVQSCGLATDLPLGPIRSSRLVIDGRPAGTAQRIPDANFAAVSPGYFSTLSIPVVGGRDIGPQDLQESMRVAVVNQAMASEYWPNDDALGKRFKATSEDPNAPWITVVGVVHDVKQEGVQFGVRQAFFVPFSQAAQDSRAMSLVVRSAADNDAVVVGAIRQRLAALDRQIPVYQVETLDARVMDSLGGEELAAMMLSVFALIVLVLSVIGILGVTSYSVSQRTHEFGLRLALGAEPARIMQLVVSNATRLALAGAGIGCVAAYVMMRVLGTLLYDVSPTDALTMCGVGAILIGVSIAASLIPARRAMSMDANVALRSD